MENESRTYPVSIKDAELLRKLGPAPVAESAAGADSLIRVADDISARTGVRVVARINEEAGTVDVKRLLVG